MLITQEPIFKRFWYPVIPTKHLMDGPKGFTLLGQNIVLWQDEKGQPCAAEDKCAHRSAMLSKGWVDQGLIVCPYHAWSYNGKGECVRFSQGNGKIPKTYQIKTYLTSEKYGYVWVCLGQPMRETPDFPEANDGAYRFVDCFYEKWNTMSLRVVENELDMAHFAVVHRGTFGNPDQPLPLSFEVNDVDDFTVHVKAELSVRVPKQQQHNTGVQLEKEHTTSTRLMNVTWMMPFTIRLSIEYPSGLHHVIINHPTPIDDDHIQVVQFCFRNDTEAEVSKEALLRFERKILNEDRAVLETTDANYPVFNEYPEAHMPTDKPGILVRKKIKHLIQRQQ